MKSVYVQFEDKTYNYTTSVNGSNSDESIEKYFIGVLFNMGHISDDMQRCIKVTITSK